jgi:hypothetical protein
LGNFNMESLKSAARAIADEDATLGASAIVEARLLAEVHAIAKARRQRASMYVAAALLLLIAAAVPVRRVFETRATAPPAQRADVSASSSENVTEFFSLGFADVPVTGAQIVRIEVPRAALRSFGVVPIDTGRAASTEALADVIIGEDGLARAVRFVGAKRIGGQVR